MKMEKPAASLVYGDETWHGGAGWYYVEDACPEEGTVGPFEDRFKAMVQAHADGYVLLNEFPFNPEDITPDAMDRLRIALKVDPKVRTALALCGVTETLMEHVFALAQIGLDPLAVRLWSEDADDPYAPKPCLRVHAGLDAFSWLLFDESQKVDHIMVGHAPDTLGRYIRLDALPQDLARLVGSVISERVSPDAVKSLLAQGRAGFKPWKNTVEGDPCPGCGEKVGVLMPDGTLPFHLQTCPGDPNG